MQRSASLGLVIACTLGTACSGGVTDLSLGGVGGAKPSSTTPGGGASNGGGTGGGGLAQGGGGAASGGGGGAFATGGAGGAQGGSGGAGGAACPGALVACDGTCVDLAVDPKHCGACGVACGPAQLCEGGACNAIVCAPGATELCYSGPVASLGLGPCKLGTKTCMQDGASYGPCAGEVVPTAAEDCATPLDDDCDGLVNEGCLFPSCKEILAHDPSAKSGVYTIDTDDAGPAAPFAVWCDMTTDGGGFTVLEKSPFGAAIGHALYEDLPVDVSAPDHAPHRLGKAAMATLAAAATDLRIDCRGQDHLLTLASNLFAGEGGPADCFNFAKILYKEASLKGHVLTNTSICTWMRGTSEGCAGAWHIDEHALANYGCGMANFVWTGQPITSPSADSFAVDPHDADALGQECHTPGAVRFVMVR